MKQNFYIIVKNETYLVETSVPTRIKFCTIGRPRLFINKRKAEKLVEKIGGNIIKIKLEKIEI